MGSSAKALKLRIKSVKSTEHITRAMQLVASSKLRRAVERVELSRSYFETMKAVFSDLAAGCGEDMPKQFFTERTEGKICLIVIAGDRGLAGGYNNNVFSLASSLGSKEDLLIVPVGKKTVEFFKKKKFEVQEPTYTAEALTMADCAKIGRDAAEKYRDGTYSKVYLVYTSFKNMLSQHAEALQMLPLQSVSTEKKKGFTLYEPSPAAVLTAIVPEYLSGMVYCGICDSYASEQAARRNAMDNATKNADEMIEKLGLQYNRARQGAITQEITEIVAGSES